jgi:DNA-binding NarL/FixJ family response regulator
LNHSCDLFVRSWNRTPILQIIAEASDGLEAVRRAEELKPDLILLNIELPNLNGIDAARQIRKLAPESKIIFVTQESDAAVVQEAFNMGAAGYVLKAKVSSDLGLALERPFGWALSLLAVEPVPQYLPSASPTPLPES